MGFNVAAYGNTINNFSFKDENLFQAQATVTDEPLDVAYPTR